MFLLGMMSSILGVIEGTLWRRSIQQKRWPAEGGGREKLGCFIFSCHPNQGRCRTLRAELVERRWKTIVPPSATVSINGHGRGRADPIPPFIMASFRLPALRLFASTNSPLSFFTPPGKRKLSSLLPSANRALSALK